MNRELLREAVDTILTLRDWARDVPDSVLDGIPETRKAYLADMNTAKELVTRINTALKHQS